MNEDNDELEEETRIACVNIENVEGEMEESKNTISDSAACDNIALQEVSNNQENRKKSKSKSLIQGSRQTRYTYDCFKCKKKFKNRSPLNLHIAREHKEEAPAVILCNLCGKQVDFDHELVLHKKFFCRKIQRPSSCQQCHLKFVEESEKEAHPCSKDPSRPYYCSVPGCDSYSKHVRDLTEHVTRHLGIKPFLCNMCGKAFSAKKDMDRHADTHKDSKDYICQECGISYRSYYTLRRHMFSHKFKDKYKCSECTYTTALKHAYNQHMIRHSQYTNQCQICKKKLRSKRSLEKHVQNRHTFNRIFTCRFCDFSTDVGLSYSSHMRNHKDAKKSDIQMNKLTSLEADIDLDDMENGAVQSEISNDNTTHLVATKLVSSATSDLTLTSVCSTSSTPMLVEAAEAAILDNMEVGITGKNVDAIMANIVASSDPTEYTVIPQESSSTNLIIYHMDTQTTSLNMPGFEADSDTIAVVSDQESWGHTSEGS